MATADERIRLLLEARNNAAGALNQVQQQMQGLNKAAGIAAAGMGAIASAAAINGIVQLGGAIYDLAQNAANFAAVRNSFEGLAAGVGQNADQMLTSMRNASQGMVSDANLVLSANRAMLLGVADTGEEMGTLLEIARVRGRAMGMDVSQAFNDIVTGLGRMSPMILDNLGITVDMEGATAKYAQTLGTTSAKLTDAQRKQALLNEVIESSKGLLEGNAGEGDAMAASFERAEASIANMKLSLGELFSPAVAAVAQSIANAVEGAMQMADPNRGLSEAQITLQSLNTALTRYNQLLAQNSGTSAYRVDNKMLEDARRNLAQLVVDYNLAAMQLNQPIIDYPKMLAGQADFFLAAEQYNPAGLLAQQAEEARQAANAQYAQMASDAQAFADQNTAIWEALTANMEGLSDSQLRRLGDNARAMYVGLIDGGAPAADAMRQVTTWIGTAANAMREANAAAAGLAPALGRVAAESSSMAEWLGVSAGAARRANAEFSALAGTAAGAWLGLSQAAAGIKAAGVDALAGVQTLARAREILSGISEQAQMHRGWEEARVALGRYNDEFNLSKGGAILQEVAYLSYPAAKGIGGMTSAVDALNQRFETLKGKAESVLSGSLTLDGINVDAMGARPDAINENARRLAAIANEGLAGQDWFGEFAFEVPDIAKMLQESGDPRAAAAQLLADFQDGLVPQLLDPEAAKEKVRRMLLGDQNMAAMAQQIAQELSQEMGISLQQAQQATGTALGLSKDGEAGTSVLDGNNEGNRFVDGVSQVLASRQQEFLAEGSNAGGQWGTGFLASVRSGLPAALIAILIAAVRSGLADDADAQGSRTGAR